MDTEKQDNWRQKLQELNSLPGEAPLNKEAAWEKLHHRLHRKPRRSKTVWYWAAAAVLLLMGLPFLLRKTPPQQLPAGNIVQQKKMYRSVNPAPSLIKEQPGIIISAPPLKKIVPQKIVKEKKQSFRTSPDPVAPVYTAAIETLLPATNIAPDNTTATVAAVSAEKKKLPVVHINELETPSTQLVILPVSVHSRFSIRLPYHPLNKQLMAVQKTHDGIVNVKISFKN